MIWEMHGQTDAWSCSFSFPRLPGPTRLTEPESSESTEWMAGPVVPNSMGSRPLSTRLNNNPQAVGFTTPRKI